MQYKVFFLIVNTMMSNACLLMNVSANNAIHKTTKTHTVTKDSAAGRDMKSVVYL